MVTVVKKWGNSLGIRLPRTIAQEAAVNEGSSVTIETRHGRIIITPVGKRRYRLEELGRGITRQNQHAAVETTGPLGKEAW